MHVAALVRGLKHQVYSAALMVCGSSSSKQPISAHLQPQGMKCGQRLNAIGQVDKVAALLQGRQRPCWCGVSNHHPSGLVTLCRLAFCILGRSLGGR